VFSQWTRILDLLEVLMQDMEMGYLRLDGSTPVKDRQDLIDTFSSTDSIPVFLLSTKAGGLGINLIAADTVVLHDLDFNPENDRQAEDRCHRIGQTKDVTVYKLVTANTVDEDIYEMGERKRELSEQVLCDGRTKKSSEAGGDDATTISAILQKALSRAVMQSPGYLKSPASVVS
jgi:SWI/SNF-related matrix-associated actin-dependent regulator 1 of chromatin subfamily A